MAFAGPNSYLDPLYAQLAAQAEQQFNLPTGILDAIRMRGERSNADQVSPSGARTPYQFIGSTRRGMINNYGTDPWASAASSTTAAAQLLAENYRRSGSWDKAIAMYNGGNHPGTAAYRYQAKVGDFDTPIDTSKPYYTGADNMASPLLTNIASGLFASNPGAPEPPTMPVPVPGSAAPSQSVPATAPVAAHKRGGILGALESVFMPNPDSLWAGALRDGVFNAKESQQAYKEQQYAKLLDLQTANEKLKQLMQHGQYQVVGNNVFHVRPDGTTEMISGPSSIDDKVKLTDLWKQRHDANPSDPTLPLIEALIYGGGYGNTPEGVAANNASREAAARVRAGATIGAARIRGPAANAASALPVIPQGWKVVH